MQLTYKYKIKNNEEILKLCKISKDLYNQSLYIIKENLKENKFLFYNDLDKIMKNKINLEGNINYRLLKTQVSQQILMSLDKNLKSYFKSIKDWKKNPSKYKGMPKLPGYKKDYNNLIYTNQSCVIINNKIQLSKKLSINLPQWKEEFKTFNQIRIIPKNNFIEVEIIYTTKELNIELNKDKYSSIDLGINNLITMINEYVQPLIISGKQIKSINQLYNKEKSILYSIKDKMNIKYTKKLYKLDEKRNDQIKDIFHKVSRYIVNYLIKNKIGNIVVGYNKSWKDSIKLGNKTNQTFVSIPYLKMIKYLEYKCKMVGINFIKNEESYTSKIDSLVLEPLKKQENYLGKRIMRGLFQSSIVKLINADVNGSLNILRKVVDDSFVKMIIDRGLLFNPIKIRDIYNLNSL
jgi:putative transposase